MGTTKMSGVWFSRTERKRLQEWLKKPNGTFGIEDLVHKKAVIFEAVQGGGVHVKIWPPA